MGLKDDNEFDQLPNITKKKVLINMIEIRNTLASDPNPVVRDGIISTLRELLTFTRENWFFLN